MRFIFRGEIVFQYYPELVYSQARQYTDLNNLIMIPEDYKLLSQFFDIVYRHINGEDVELKDIIVN